MRIAQIAPLIERVPPKKYGGTERVVSALTEELVRRGHKVTLFASGDSITSARLVYIHPQALREANVENIYGSNIFTLLNFGTAYSRQEEFDVIHDHTGYLSLPTANISTTPVVITLHGALDSNSQRIFAAFKNPYLVSISKSQALDVPRINRLATVYNALPMDHYPFSQKNNGYLLFVGRICPEKGTHLAVEVAKKLNLPLIIAAKLESANISYFKKYVAPFLNDRIRWIGEVDEKARNKLMSQAMCFLHPITWEEPFGLTMIEAMACGCPVIGINQGSVPEIISHGHTGFVVKNVKEMARAVDKIPKISRKACRLYALKNFSAEKMAQGYEKVYERIIREKELSQPQNNHSKLSLTKISTLGSHLSLPELT